MNDNINNRDDSLNDELNEENLSAIDGQIGMEELFIREDENNNEPNEETYIPPINNQISLDDFIGENSILKSKNELLNEDALGIFNNKKTESLDEFFKEETDETSQEEMQNNAPENASESSEEENALFSDLQTQQAETEQLNSEEELSLADLIGSEGSQTDEPDNLSSEEQNTQYGANLGLNSEFNEEEPEPTLNNSPSFNNSKEINNKEGLSALEDNNNYNNNNNFENENNQNNNEFSSNQNEQNYGEENFFGTENNNAPQDYTEENSSYDNYENPSQNGEDSEENYAEENSFENSNYVSNEQENYEQPIEEENASTPNDNLESEETISTNEPQLPEELEPIEQVEEVSVEEVPEEQVEPEQETEQQETNEQEVTIKPKKVRAASKENYFENEENAQVIEDVDALNKDYEEVSVVAGKDAFGDYADSALETDAIEENEVEPKKEKVYSGDGGEDVVDGMLYKTLDTVLHESMIPYSEHVILDRALPRVEDGLKPVQRRILYSMLELGVTPDKPFRKSARIVGDCLGKYHPHGDSSVYDAMVRMAQPFNTNMLLVSGHGNFGSVDGDGAAAMRYTEARLAPLSMELLRDLDKNTVKWGLNFDDTLKEPEILPGRFPNLLVNGATGIAVGLATNIPPHNLGEAIDGVVAYLNNPSIKLKEMLKIIKGPDFPTGGYILNNSELYQAYETGRGKIYMRAKMHIESNGSDKRYIVITELPYQVNKSSLLQKIANYKDEAKFGFDGISEVRDESDREGLRAVIRLKKDADLKAIYKSLLKNTELQTTFGINMVAIANGKPKQMGLLDIISYYAEYQREIILRRSKYELEQAREREHILTGLIIAIKNIDAVIKIIKTSQNTTEAKKRLREKFVLSERQAQAILDMRLAKLTSLEVYKLEEELKKLRELIKKLEAIINSKKLQKEIVRDELLQIKRQYKQDRKTKFAKAEEEINSAPEPKEEATQKVVILKTAENTFKCVNIKQYNYAQKETNENSTLFDTHILKIETETNNTLLAFSSLGNCFKIDVKTLSLSRYRDKGVPENAIFKELGKNETIVALFNDSITSQKEGNFIFLTKYGMIKKTAFTEYALLKRYYQGMKLKDDDEILSVVIEPKDYTYIFVTKQGMVLNADNSDVPLQGRISGGVKGINLANNDYCVGACLAGDAGEVLAVTNKGFVKRVVIANIDKSARYRKGLKFFTFTADNGRELIYANVVTKGYTLGAVDSEGQLRFRNTEHIPIENRTGKGKAIEKMKKSLFITKAFKIDN